MARSTGKGIEGPAACVAAHSSSVAILFDLDAGSSMLGFSAGSDAVSVAAGGAAGGAGV